MPKTGMAISLLRYRIAQRFEEDLRRLADTGEAHVLAVAVHRRDHVGWEQGGKDAVALRALRAERVRVGAVRNQDRCDGRFRVTPFDRRLEVAIQRRVR